MKFGTYVCPVAIYTVFYVYREVKLWKKVMKFSMFTQFQVPFYRELCVFALEIWVWVQISILEQDYLT